MQTGYSEEGGFFFFSAASCLCFLKIQQKPQPGSLPGQKHFQQTPFTWSRRLFINWSALPSASSPRTLVVPSSILTRLALLLPNSGTLNTLFLLSGVFVPPLYSRMIHCKIFPDGIFPSVTCSFLCSSLAISIDMTLVLISTSKQRVNTILRSKKK